MDKYREDVVYIRNGILFRHEKKGNPVVCDIMNGP